MYMNMPRRKLLVKIGDLFNAKYFGDK